MFNGRSLLLLLLLLIKSLCHGRVLSVTIYPTAVFVCLSLRNAVRQLRHSPARIPSFWVCPLTVNRIQSNTASSCDAISRPWVAWANLVRIHEFTRNCFALCQWRERTLTWSRDDAQRMRERVCNALSSLGLQCSLGNSVSSGYWRLMDYDGLQQWAK